MTVGQRLREAREARHLTLGDIARRTFIQMRLLQAIDEDDLHAVPASHLRLFLREYARIVDIDPQELYDLLPDTIPPTGSGAPANGEAGSSPLPAVQTISFEDRVVDEEERRANRALLDRLSSGRGVKLVGGGASAWMMRGAVVLLLALGLYFGIHALVGGDSNRQAYSDAVAAGDSSQTQILPRSTEDTAGAVSETDSLTLEGHANGRVWFALVSDGKKSEQGTIDSGDVRTWRAFKQFKISLSNAGDLELVLNGTSLGTLGPRKTSIRNQMIDASGLVLRGPAARIHERAVARESGQSATSAESGTTSSSSQNRSSSSRRSNSTRNKKRDRPIPDVTPTAPRGGNPIQR